MALRDRLAKLVRRWPNEVTREGDDLGSFLRKLYQQKAPSIHTEEAVDSLEKISTNYYRKKYCRKDESSYTNMAKHLEVHDPWTPPRHSWKSTWRQQMIEQNKLKWYQRILPWGRK